VQALVRFAWGAGRPSADNYRRSRGRGNRHPALGLAAAGNYCLRAASEILLDFAPFGRNRVAPFGSRRERLEPNYKKSSATQVITRGASLPIFLQQMWRGQTCAEVVIGRRKRRPCRGRCCSYFAGLARWPLHPPFTVYEGAGRGFAVRGSRAIGPTHARMGQSVRLCARCVASSDR